MTRQPLQITITVRPLPGQSPLSEQQEDRSLLELNQHKLYERLDALLRLEQQLTEQRRDLVYDLLNLVSETQLDTLELKHSILESSEQP